jgi:quinol monooxygenase YgiN
VHTVFVTMDCDPADQGRLLELARASLDVFAAQPGFVSAGLHRSLDGGQLVTHLVWDSKGASDACMTSPDFATSRAVQAFSAMADEGRATMIPRDFELVDSRGG